MTEDIRVQIRDAVYFARRELGWRPAKARIHLQKRISQGHLNSDATLDEYEAIIRQILHERQAKVFVFSYQGKNYPTLFSESLGKPWLVMVDIEGQMETAFVVEKPEIYFADSRFTYLGECQEILR